MVIETEITLPTMALVLQSVMAPEDIAILFVDVSRMVRDESVHAYCNYYVWWGQKPVEGLY